MRLHGRPGCLRVWRIRAAENPETERQLRDLQQQNQALQEQLRQQQKLRYSRNL